MKAGLWRCKSGLFRKQKRPFCLVKAALSSTNGGPFARSFSSFHFFTFLLFYPFTFLPVQGPFYFFTFTKAPLPPQQQSVIPQLRYRAKCGTGNGATAMPRHTCFRVRTASPPIIYKKMDLPSRQIHPITLT